MFLRSTSHCWRMPPLSCSVLQFGKPFDVLLLWVNYWLNLFTYSPNSIVYPNTTTAASWKTVDNKPLTVTRTNWRASALWPPRWPPRERLSYFVLHSRRTIPSLRVWPHFWLCHYYPIVYLGYSCVAASPGHGYSLHFHCIGLCIYVYIILHYNLPISLFQCSHPYTVSVVST